MSLARAIDQTRTGDIWLFRGHSGADRAIQTLTNSPVNHVGMALVLEDLPALMWHAELGRSLPDVWAGAHRRGAQLHDLHDAVEVWAHRYGQRAWVRQLRPDVDRAGEDAVLRTIARLDGTPFPSVAGVIGRWLTSKAPRRRQSREINAPEQPDSAEHVVPPADGSALETAYCAEIVAITYQEIGLLPTERPPGWYDPGRFWSGDGLRLERGYHLGKEIEVSVPALRPPPRR